MARRVKLIFNPIANLGRAWHIAASLRPIVYEFGGADWTGTVYPTHATELARQAGEEGYDLVVAMGGDGTVHEVVNGLMQVSSTHRPALGIVPVGSGNDFAHSLGISAQADTALRQVLSGSPKPIDIGQFRLGDGQIEYFSNTVGIGFDTIVTIHSRQVPFFQGFGVYFIAVLKTILQNYAPFRINIETETGSRQEEMLMLVLCNGGREGGGFHVAPTSKPDDGLLNFTSVQKISRLRMLMTLPRFMNGTQDELPYVHSGSFRSMKLVSESPLFIHADGEIIGGVRSNIHEMEIKILAGEINAIH